MKRISFIVDSGATTSVLSQTNYSGPKEKSAPSMGINGISTPTYKTKSIMVADCKGRYICHHKFSIIPKCPVNLLGRDLFKEFELSITIDGLTGAMVVNSPYISITPEDSETTDMTDTIFVNIPTDIPETVWAENNHDTGLINCTPYRATLRPQTEPIYIKQYPLSAEKKEGIEPLVTNFLKQGILEYCISPYNTPVNPVKKPNGTYRFVQDLRAINSLIIPIAPIVPDISTLLATIPHDATHFTVIDLKNAFFSVPVDKETRPLFAFSLDGKRQMTWTRLPQGYVDAPVVYSIVLQSTLRPWDPPQGSVVLQYVDDLMVCSKSEEACQQDSMSLLKWLMQCGHKVSKDKLQWCTKQVEYLGFVFSEGERKLSKSRVEAIVGLVNPHTKKEMLSFLGMVNYCRQWISDCSYYDNILRQATLKESPDKIQWSDEMLKAFNALKCAMTKSPGLGLPDFGIMFHLYARDNCKTMAGVLAQEHGGKMRPVAFFSKVLPLTVQGFPSCLRSLATCAMVVELATTFTLGHMTTLHTTHDVLGILKGIHTQHMSAQRQSGYEIILLSNPNLKVQYNSSTTGPAMILNGLLGLKSDWDQITEEHDCLETIETNTSPRPDLQKVALQEGDVVFVDGSCSRPNDNTYQAGYAVVKLPNVVIEAKPISQQSAQAAELIALTRACTLYAGKPVTIYTDSRYAHGVVFDHGVLWSIRGYVGADGKKISHAQLITNLLDAIRLPSELAIIHCRAHTQGSDEISKGNALADATAKAVSKTIGAAFVSITTLLPLLPDETQLLTDLQSSATQEELADWCYPVLQKSPKTGLICKEGKPCIPKHSAPIYIAHVHGIGHIGWKATLQQLKTMFYITDAEQLVKNFVQRCITCIRNNPNNPTKVAHEHLPYPVTPFTHLQIDFTHMPTPTGGTQPVCVIVDVFSRWPEVFPTKKEDAATVAGILTREIIPRWGIPLQINSDQGSAFTSKLCGELSKLLRIDWKFHIPYHPQSSGIVERMNRTLKDKIRKATGGTFQNWKRYLPAILAEIRMTPTRKVGYSPFEVLFGRPFPTPWCRKTFMTLDNLDNIRDEYVRKLIETLISIEENVTRKCPLSSQENSHPFQEGDEVVIKLHPKGKKPQEFTYGPPTTIVAVTRTAVLTEDSPTWIHATRVKLVKKGPSPKATEGPQDPEARKEVLTGADSSDLEQDSQEKGVLTGADSPDPVE